MSDLPILPVLPALHAALLAAPNALLIAPPGAGKTTVVPTALLDAPWRGDGRILVLEPRRLAARAAAARMAALRGEAVGEVVGFRTRLESAVSSRTRVEVVTQGLLLRRLLSDPGLDGVAAVLLDEVHERSLDADLALALCLDLQRVLRPELRLLAMSATPDGARLAALMGAAVVRSEGRAHPVEVRHAARDITHPRELADAVAGAVRAALAEHAGDVLAFLPGMGEIRRAQAALAGCGALVLPLHGELPPAEQDLALRPAAGRRVVLATAVAETSLTVPGVRVVVDGGWRRAPRLDGATGLTRLHTLRVSRAAAEQRAGRAGREAPGVAVRLWTAALHRGLAPFDPPELLGAELSPLLLACSAWGTAPERLPFADPPPAGALAAAAALLERLGALDGERGITAHGRRMAELGAHPRLAAMMLAARGAGERALAAELAALLEERDPLRPRPRGTHGGAQAGGARGLRGGGAAGGGEGSADLALRLAVLRGEAAEGGVEVDRGAVARIRQGAAQYRRRLGVAGPGEDGEGMAGSAAALVAAAFPDRVAQRRGEPGSFRLSGGGGARLGRGDALAAAPLLAVAALEGGASATIRLAAPLDPARLPPVLERAVTETLEEGLDSATGAVVCRRRRRLGALVLEDRVVPPDPARAAALLARALLARPEQLPWTDAARQLQARAALLRTLEGEAVADLSDAALATEADWLAPHLLGMGRLSEVAARLDLHAALRARLGAAAARLERELPAQVPLPGGRAAVDYTGPVPVASARAQHFFGLRETPRLAGGRVALRLALLSPAGRPVAVTADLARFWEGGWAEVRREMRGRYPRHDWPERPGG